MIDYDKVIPEKIRNIQPSGIRKFFDIAQQVEGVISLSVGEPDFKTPWAARKAAIGVLEKGRTAYTANAGLIQLREEISKYLLNFIHTEYDPNGEIIVTVGGSEALDLAMRALIQPGDEVLVPEPSFVCYSPIITVCGGTPVPIVMTEEDKFKLRADALKAKITPRTKALILPFPNNPTGSLIPEDMMKEIVEIARSSGAYILCDEVYAGVSIEGAACPSIADLYEKGIATGSMSKAFSLAGLRLGWLATKSQEALRQFKRVRDYDLVSCGLFDEETAALALRHKEKILERNRAILRENLPILDAWVKEEPRTSYVRPRAGTMALVYYDLDIDSNIFSQRMFKETGAFAVPGTCFEERRALRIGYGHDGEALKEGLSVVSSFMRKLEEEGIPVIKE